MKKWAHELNREFSKKSYKWQVNTWLNVPLLWLQKSCKSKQHLYFILPQLEWPYSRVITTTNAGQDAVKQEPLYIVGENAN
jgi:hypothetical protein